jgi:hypothetical protein
MDNQNVCLISKTINYKRETINPEKPIFAPLYAAHFRNLSFTESTQKMHNRNAPET